jgi:Protein of unknown function (DUF3631)
MPQDLINRGADNWRPLLAVAKAVGEDWHARIMAAATAYQQTHESQDRGLLLLAHLHAVWISGRAIPRPAKPPTGSCRPSYRKPLTSQTNADPSASTKAGGISAKSVANQTASRSGPIAQEGSLPRSTRNAIVELSLVLTGANADTLPAVEAHRHQNIRCVGLHFSA